MNEFNYRTKIDKCSFCNCKANEIHIWTSQQVFGNVQIHYRALCSKHRLRDD
jgi:hypothetical protein